MHSHDITASSEPFSKKHNLSCIGKSEGDEDPKQMTHNTAIVRVYTVEQSTVVPSRERAIIGAEQYARTGTYKIFGTGT